MGDLTLDGFIGMLGKGVVGHAHYTERALREGARAVEKASKEMLGHNRPEWPALAGATQDRRVALGFSANDPLLMTHELHSHVESDVKLEQHGGTAIVGVKDATVGDGSKRNPVRNIGDVAVFMELGTSKAPARSFLALAATDAAKELHEAFGRRLVTSLFRS